MAFKEFAVALGMIVAVSPASAAISKPNPPAIDSSESAGARYCLRIEAVTGSRLETIRSWTREEWAAQGVDVDKEWAREGVEILR